MKYLSVLLILSGFVMWSCEDSTSTEDESSTVSLPMKVGNSWTYTYTYHIESTGETSEPAEVSIEIVSDTTVNGVQWFLFQSESSIANTFLSGYYSNQENGIYARSGFETDGNKKIIEKISTAIESNSPFTVPKISSDSIGLNDGETNLSLFLHNPDQENPNKLLKSNYEIGSLSYHRSSENLKFNTLSEIYTKEFYQVYASNRVYGVSPDDYYFEISNEVGLITIEMFYFSSGNSTDEDRRLSKHSTVRFELQSYSFE